MSEQRNIETDLLSLQDENAEWSESVLTYIDQVERRLWAWHGPSNLYATFEGFRAHIRKQYNEFGSSRVGLFS